MSIDSDPHGAVLPVQMPLLLFHAAGVALGVEAAAAEGILDAEQARQAGVACRELAGLPGAAGVAPPRSDKRLLLRSRGARCVIGIDSLEEIVTIPVADLQPLPGPLSRFRGPRAFWGGIVRRNKVVLLVDVDRLLEPAREAAANEGRPNAADEPSAAACQ